MSREELEEELEQSIAAAVMRGVGPDEIRDTLDTMQARTDVIADVFGGGGR